MSDDSGAQLPPPPPDAAVEYLRHHLPADCVDQPLMIQLAMSRSTLSTMRCAQELFLKTTDGADSTTQALARLVLEIDVQGRRGKLWEDADVIVPADLLYRKVAEAKSFASPPAQILPLTLESMRAESGMSNLQFFNKIQTGWHPFPHATGALAIVPKADVLGRSAKSNKFSEVMATLGSIEPQENATSSPISYEEQDFCVDPPSQASLDEAATNWFQYQSAAEALASDLSTMRVYTSFQELSCGEMSRIILSVLIFLTLRPQGPRLEDDYPTLRLITCVAALFKEENYDETGLVKNTLPAKRLMLMLLAHCGSPDIALMIKDALNTPQLQDVVLRLATLSEDEKDARDGVLELVESRVQGFVNSVLSVRISVLNDPVLVHAAASYTASDVPSNNGLLANWIYQRLPRLVPGTAQYNVEPLLAMLKYPRQFVKSDAGWTAASRRQWLGERCDEDFPAHHVSNCIWLNAKIAHMRGERGRRVLDWANHLVFQPGDYDHLDDKEKLVDQLYTSMVGFFNMRDLQEASSDEDEDDSEDEEDADLRQADPRSTSVSAQEILRWAEFPMSSKTVQSGAGIPYQFREHVKMEFDLCRLEARLDRTLRGHGKLLRDQLLAPSSGVQGPLEGRYFGCPAEYVRLLIHNGITREEYRDHLRSLLLSANLFLDRGFLNKISQDAERMEPGDDYLKIIQNNVHREVVRFLSFNAPPVFGASYLSGEALTDGGEELAAKVRLQFLGACQRFVKEGVLSPQDWSEVEGREHWWDAN